MDEIIFRDAVIGDIPFLVETIIEAEKSGTNKLSYSTIFGLTELEVQSYLADMLKEEVDGCELSVSSFLVAESNGKVAAAVSAWVEGQEGIPSSLIKGNILQYVLPKSCIEKAMEINDLIQELYIECLPDTIQLAAGYVAREFRGNRILGTLLDKIIHKLKRNNPEVNDIYTQVFSCNTPSLKTVERAGFLTVLTKESSRDEINKYLPSNKKYLFKRTL